MATAARPATQPSAVAASDVQSEPHPSPLLGKEREPDQSTPPADVAIGGEVVMRIRSSAAHLSPQDRAANVTDRLTKLLAVPDLTPADVVVYSQPNTPPVIYVLGRKLITVATADVVAAGGGPPVDLAKRWARRLQQVLPLVDIRLPNEPEPTVDPSPPLVVTDDLAQVGGSVGQVVFRDHVVIRLRGAQQQGQTAAELADAIADRLNRVVHDTGASSPEDVAVTKVPQPPFRIPMSIRPPSASLTIGGRNVVTVEPPQSEAAGVATPTLLAQSWAKNIRAVLASSRSEPTASSASPPVPAAGVEGVGP